MAKPFDIVLFGATGFTGKLAAEYMLTSSPSSVRFAIAGRSRSKLDELKAQLAKLSSRASEVGVLVADSGDQASIDAMADQTRVIASTAGPFTKYGTPVVDACVRLGVHYVDITGESNWIRTIIDKYHDKAVKDGTLVVHCCGMDCIPSDLGAFVVASHIRSQLNSNTALVKAGVQSMKPGTPSGGTMASVFAVFESGSQISSPYELNPPERPKVKSKDHLTVTWDKDFKSWTTPSPLALTDLRIVNRSQALQNFAYGPNFKFSCFKLSKSWFSAISNVVLLATLAMLANFRLGRWLLKKVVPAPGEGPSREKQERGQLRMRLLGITDPESPNEKPRRVFGSVICPVDPGYLGTAKMICESALAIALSREKLAKGGVMTPASAFGNVLVDRLRTAGLQFNIDSTE